MFIPGPEPKAARSRLTLRAVGTLGGLATAQAIVVQTGLSESLVLGSLQTLSAGDFVKMQAQFEAVYWRLLVWPTGWGAPSPGDKITTRGCLLCRNEFESAGRGNWVCDECKGRDVWAGDCRRTRDRPTLTGARLAAIENEFSAKPLGLYAGIVVQGNSGCGFMAPWRMVDWRPRKCQFIEGPPSADEACKCLEPVVECLDGRSYSYCAAHLERCYKKKRADGSFENES